MIIEKYPLGVSNYHVEGNKKNKVILHHTYSKSASHTIDFWKSNKNKIGTPYLIERDGTIIEAFDPKYWASMLGIPGAEFIEKTSIQISLVAFGALTKKDGKYYNYLKQEIEAREVATLPKPFRGSIYYQRYTSAQILALKELLLDFKQKFGITIPIDLDLDTFLSYNLQNGNRPGIWGHSTLKEDVQDIYPDAGLLRMLGTLKLWH